MAVDLVHQLRERRVSWSVDQALDAAAGAGARMPAFVIQHGLQQRRRRRVRARVPASTSTWRAKTRTPISSMRQAIASAGTSAPASNAGP